MDIVAKDEDISGYGPGRLDASVSGIHDTSTDSQTAQSRSKLYFGPYVAVGNSATGIRS